MTPHNHHSEEWRAAQTVAGLTPQQEKQHKALVAMGLVKLRTAYPTQARNFSPEEVAATNALWAEVFAGVAPELLHKAVIRFIATDRRERKFFPSPGDIAEVVEKIVAEGRAEEKRRDDFKKERKRLTRLLLEVMQ